MAEKDYMKPPFTVELPDGQTLDFENYQEIRQWADSELSAWAFPDEVARTWKPIFNELDTRQRGVFRELSMHAARAENDAQSRAPVAQHLARIANGGCIVSDSVKGRQILDYMKESPDRALGALYWEMPVPISSRNIGDLGPILRGIVESRLADWLGVASVEAEQEALTAMRKNWAKKFSKQHKTEAEQLRAFEDYVSAEHAQVTRRIRNLRRIVAKRIRRHRQALTDHERDMAAIRNTFQTELSLREPANYWTNKANGHRSAAVWAFIGLVVMTAVVIGFSIKVPTWFLAKESIQNLAFGGTLLLAIPAIALLWIMKSVARIFVTNLNMHNDARLRHTMITTFVSLMQDPDNKLGLEDRLLILQAVFRPAGAEAQEEGPPTWADFLLRRMDGKQ